MQGKTSRWAIAWSFDVDPNLANVPLPRAVNPALQQPMQPKRVVSFSLQVRLNGHIVRGGALVRRGGLVQRVWLRHHRL